MAKAPLLSESSPAFIVYLPACVADLIGAEKTGLLCELLDEVGRKDLTAIVKEYVNKLDFK